MVRIFANDSIVYIQDEMKINDAIKNIYEDVNNRRRIKAALKDYHFDHMIQDDKSMAVRKLGNGKDIEHLHISADDLHNNHVKFLEFLKNLHVEEVQSTAEECIPTTETIEKVSILKEIANDDNIRLLHWSNSGVGYYLYKDGFLYVRALDDNNFSLLKDMIDVYLDVKTNQQNNIFSAEEVEKIQKIDDSISSNNALTLYWTNGKVKIHGQGDDYYVQLVDNDIDFSLLKKILKVCLVGYNAQAVTSTMIPAVKTRPKEEIKSVKRLKTAIDKGYAWFLGWDVGSVYNYGKAYYYYARPNEVKPLMKEFINLYLQAHGNENN